MRSLFYCAFLSVNPVHALEIEGSSSTELNQLAQASEIEKIRLYRSQAESLLESEPFRAYEIANKALEILKQKRPSTYTAEIYDLMISAARNMEDAERVKKTIKMAIFFAKTHLYSEYLAQFYNELARFYWSQSDYEGALDALKNALPEYEKAGKQAKVGSIHNNIGIIYRNLGDYDKALHSYSKALTIRRQIGDKLKIAYTLNNIGVLYKEFNYDDQSLEVLLNAVALFDELDSQEDLADPLNNIGLVYEKKQNYALALEYLEKSLKIEKALNNKRGIAYSLNNIGALNRKIKRYDISLQQLENALSLAQEIGERSLIARVHRELAQNYFEVGQYSDANLQVLRSLEFAEVIKDKEQLKLSNQLYADVLSANEDYKGAFNAYKLYKEYSDQLDSESNNKLFSQFQNRLEMEKKENEIVLLKQQNEIQKLDNERKDAIRNVSLVSFVSLLVIIFLLLNRRIHKRSLEKERELNHKLTQVDILKNQFLANTSHELLTPLNGIIGLSEALSVTEENEETKQTMSLIASSGAQLTKLVNDLLDLSKLSQDSMQLKLETLNVNQLCREAVELLAPNAKDKKLSLVSDLSTVDTKIFADKKRIRQVLNNIITNAIKFTEFGGVTVSCIQDKGEVVIKISDTGIGIPKEKLDRIFESFEQVDGAYNRKQGGAGIGLAICKKLVEQQKGQIMVDSIEGKGTNFYLLFPQL